MKRVLLAEDSPTQAIFFRRTLEKGGFDVRVAKDGVEALAEIDTYRPNVILTDLDMPNMDGLELVRRVRERAEYIPVVLMTGKGSEETAMEALKAGATYFFPKRLLGDEGEVQFAPTLSEIVSFAEAHRSVTGERDFPARAYHEYEIGNDANLAHELILNIGAVLKQRGFNDGQLMQINLALTEGLTNAINHGNLEVSSDLRDEENGMEKYLNLAEQRRSEHPYKDRSVKVKAFFEEEEVKFVIADEGPGFDISLIPDPTDPAYMERTSGRGLMLIFTFMDEVSHNKLGNQITIVKRRADDDDDDSDDDIFGYDGDDSDDDIFGNGADD